MEIIEFTEKVRQSILEQLATPNKLGLVSPGDNDCHMDVDYPLTLRAVMVINTHLFTFANLGISLADYQYDQVASIFKKVGESAENELLNACENKNVLKGAFFAVALVTSAYFRLLQKGEPTEKGLSEEIKNIALELPDVKGTHGADVRESYNVEGAMGSARRGYEDVFNISLPLLRQLRKQGISAVEAYEKTLLKLISITQDTCVYYRQAGLAEDIKKIADYLFNNYNEENMSAARSYFKRCNISTGGSGDLLILTILFDKLFPQE